MASGISTYRPKRTSLVGIIGIVILGTASGVGSKQVNVSADGVRTYDISGDWQWEESNVSMVPGYVAGLIGIEDEGPTLLPEDKAIQIARQLCAGLAARTTRVCCTGISSRPT